MFHILTPRWLPTADELPAADPPGAAPVAAPRRRSRPLAMAGSTPSNPLLEKAFPRRARLPPPPAGRSDAAFFAGAGLALLDTILRENPPFAGALRQRLALQAAVSCAKIARRREDAANLRDAEHLAPVGGETSPAGRVHRLWRLFASRSSRLDAPTLGAATALLDLSDGANFEALAEAFHDIVATAKDPLAAAAGVSAAAMQLFCVAPSVDAEILALWTADVALAQRLGWDAPVPLLATAIAHASLRRGATGKRPRPGDPDWTDAVAGAYALAAQEAFALAGELSRRSQALLASKPILRAKGAGRVVELLLDDDAVSPARAAKVARLSDRAARRLFDRLVALSAVRELSGRPNFRLYGL
jgi:hypothetical protein